jgi:hypothetical protein
MTKWQFIGFIPDGSPLTIDGIDVWKSKWEHAKGEEAEVIDPEYGEKFSLPIYRIVQDAKVVQFAACEVSNCMWGFYKAIEDAA